LALSRIVERLLVLMNNNGFGSFGDGRKPTMCFRKSSNYLL
jgi:hypothetical protein